MGTGREEKIHDAIWPKILPQDLAENVESNDAPALAEAGDFLYGQFQFDLWRISNHPIWPAAPNRLLPVPRVRPVYRELSEACRSSVQVHFSACLRIAQTPG